MNFIVLELYLDKLLKIHLPYDSETPILDTYLRETETYVYKRLVYKCL